MNQSPVSLMSQSEYARHRGVHRSYITRLKQNGVLVMAGNRVDVRASDAILDDRPDTEPQEAVPPRLVRPAAEPSGQAGASFAQARTIEMVFRAKLRRLEFETKQATLIDAELVSRRIAEHLHILRAGLLGLADRLAGTIATQSDAKRVHAFLKAEITRELYRLARAIGRAAE